MNVVIEIDYSTKFLVPEPQLSTWVTLLGQARKIEGYNATTSRPIEYSIKQPDPELDKELSPREEKLIAEKDSMSKYWTDERAKTAELTKQVSDMQTFKDSPEYLQFLVRQAEGVNKDAQRQDS